MDDNLQEYIKAVGALAEMMRLYREKLMKNGFTRREAIQIAQNIILEQMKQNRKEDNYYG